MNSLATKSPPAFVCLRCGNCCRHTGEVRLADQEAESIAAALAMPPTEFTTRYTRLREDRRGLALLDHPDGSCIFLAPTASISMNPDVSAVVSTKAEPQTCDSPSFICLIQSVKPKQCREFPLSWKYENLTAICPASPPIHCFPSPIPPSLAP